jgi:23S rRNA (cytidine1920-2'-O)/16S rRNA (cytidine1409-2'-O)-methyltransferase
MEERLDKILLQRGLVSTRVRAEQIIREHGVMVNGKLLNKTGKKIPLDAKIELLAEEIPYVSRGALKLKHALDNFTVEITGKTAMDIGASTGGFTEILLENGIQKVYCVDVGTEQLHQRIKDDERVINLEKTHVRELNSRLIPEKCDLVVIDVSFISLEKVLPFLHPLLNSDADCIVLVKPQFEVGKKNIGKGGIVKNKRLYPEVIENIQKVGKLNNLIYQMHIESPILGGDGNQEFLMWLKRN